MSGAPHIYHEPVMQAETLEGLAVREGGAYIDCTLGDAGHAIAILEAALAKGPAGARVLGLDADPEAASNAGQRLAAFAEERGIPQPRVVNTNFASLDATAREQGFMPADGVLFDLGLSSRQLDAEERGFSFRRPDPLDMRFNPNEGPSADDLVNGLPEEELANIIYRLGEEPRSRRIARAIVANRPITDAQHLAEVVRRGAGYPRGRTHPATRTFQALRMAVNREIESLQAGLEQAAQVLGHGGRLVTIAYHSLEDREIKRFMIGGPSMEQPIKQLSKKVIKPSKAEVERNRRARSARMRVAEKA
ncbi:MAG: 16S rRNA (cytosine(1402)-N(4))-methyltransferase RsmH [Dehalococcoidia bacterium]